MGWPMRHSKLTDQVEVVRPGEVLTGLAAVVGRPTSSPSRSGPSHRNALMAVRRSGSFPSLDLFPLTSLPPRTPDDYSMDLLWSTRSALVLFAKLRLPRAPLCFCRRLVIFQSLTLIFSAPYELSVSLCPLLTLSIFTPLSR